MGQAFTFSQIFCNRLDVDLQAYLNRLSLKKISWDRFLVEVEDLQEVTRMQAMPHDRSLLHLAIRDQRWDIVEKLSDDFSLLYRRDRYGISSVDLAKYLHDQKSLKLLCPLDAKQGSLQYPKGTDLEVIDHPIFESMNELEKALETTEKNKNRGVIPGEKIWMGVYFEKEICFGIHPPISIRYIDSEIGYGVFAEKPISSCAFVGEYTGMVRNKSVRWLKDKRYCLRYNLWEKKDNLTIDGELYVNFTRFINHSDTPNICLQSVYCNGLPRMIFLSLRAIREHEQLFFDYGPLFWKKSKAL